MNNPSRFSQRQQEVIRSLLRAMLPDGRVFPGASDRTLRSFEEWFGGASDGTVKAIGRALEFVDATAILRTGRRFSKLPSSKQSEILGKWVDSPILRSPLLLMGIALKTIHFDHPDIYDKVGYAYVKGGPAEPAKWLSQIMGPSDWEDGEEYDCDVVVVGSGAGGAVVGTELALKGHAVIFLEEGDLYRRDAFNGNIREAHEKFYRGKGAIFSIGNNAVPVLMGKLVGGSTAINTGVSYWTPDRILNGWCERIGTGEFEPSRMQPYFEKVERELQVVPGDEKFLQGAGRMIAKGADALGWHHYVLRRNAPDCTGEGVCDFGCPSAARRSVDISYLPQAFGRGSVLFKQVRADKILVENGKAVGVLGRSTTDGKTLWIRARKVIFAGGGVPTPAFLLQQGICNSSGQVGRNLSLHPSTGCAGYFPDQELVEETFVPNTRGVDEFIDEDIIIHAGQAPLGGLPLMVPLVGRKLMDVMDHYKSVCGAGPMICDHGRQGRVRLRDGGKALITYSLTSDDVQKLHRGLCLTAKMWLAAGAERAFPLTFRFPEIRGEDDLRKFEKTKLNPWDFALVSWHPLGTCDMGHDPKRHVVDTNHETHDIKNFHIVDGSTVPGPLGVNPQITIMAMATRAAEKIHERL